MTSLVIVGVGFHSTSQNELDLIVCETISTRVYLVNETDIMLYFQTSTQLLPIQEENWVMDHGLLLTFYFSLDGLFFTMCQVLHLRFRYENLGYILQANVSTLFSALGTMLDCVSEHPNRIPERRV